VVENESLLGREPEESLPDRSGANAKVRCKRARNQALTGLKPPAHEVALDFLIGLLTEAASGKRLKQPALFVTKGSRNPAARFSSTVQFCLPPLESSRAGQCA
jgi:hypothetical protein